MEALLVKVLTTVLPMMASGLVEEFGDELLDWIENKVAATDNKIDDALILPVIKDIRERYNIPDNDPK